MIDFGKIFSQAFHYAFSKDKILPMFILNSILFLSFLFTIQTLIEFLLSKNPSSFILNFSTIIGIFILVFFASLFFKIAYVHNSFSFPKNKKLSTSFKHVKEKYINLLGAVILISTISIIILFSIPIIGDIINIILGFIFFLYVPIIILEKKGIIDSLKESYRIFMKNKLNVLIYSLILFVINFIAFFVVFFAAFILVSPVIFENYEISQKPTQNIMPIISSIQENILFLAIVTIFCSLISAYFGVFEISSLTFFYKQLKKSRK